MAVRDVLDRLKGVKRNGDGWIGRCPAHEDETPSLSISEGSDGRVLIHCHAGCSYEGVTQALGLGPGDLFTDHSPDGGHQRKLTEDHALAALHNRGLRPETIREFQIVFDVASQALRIPVGSGCKMKRLTPGEPKNWWDGKKPASGADLYNLDRIPLGTVHVLLLEGEPDVWIAHQAGLRAVTFTGGATTVPVSGVQALVDFGIESVTVVYDADVAGRNGAVKAAKALREAGLEVTIGRLPAHLPPGSDVSDLYKQLNRDDDAFAEAMAELEEVSIALEDPGGQRDTGDEGGGKDVEPLFDPTEFRFGRFFLSKPPDRKWVIKDVLPMGVAGILASMGGAGKSFFIYQLLIAICLGLRFLGLELGEPGGAVYLAAEDDEPELHRRGLTLLEHYEELAKGAGGSINRKVVADRLHVIPRVAEDNLLTRTRGTGEVHHTHLVERLIEAVMQIPDLRLIAVDPISRFRGGKANIEEDATRFVVALEVIREATGATVLGLAHVSQVGIKEGGGQEIVRGSTALVDGVRFVATLQRLRREQAKNYGVDKEEAHRYLRLEVPKSNYAAPFPGLWIRREPGGLMVPASLEEVKVTKAAEKTQERYLKVVKAVQALIKERGPMTSNRIENEYAGESGLLGAGQKTVRGVIQRAVSEGDLIEKPNPGKGGGYLLDVPGGDA